MVMKQEEEKKEEERVRVTCWLVCVEHTDRSNDGIQRRWCHVIAAACECAFIFACVRAYESVERCRVMLAFECGCC